MKNRIPTRELPWDRWASGLCLPGPGARLSCR